MYTALVGHVIGERKGGNLCPIPPKPFAVNFSSRSMHEPGSREALEAQHGQVWNTEQLSAEFDVLGFLAPLVVVRRKSDRQKGSLEFQHCPRFYFGFRAD